MTVGLPVTMSAVTNNTVAPDPSSLSGADSADPWSPHLAAWIPEGGGPSHRHQEAVTYYHEASVSSINGTPAPWINSMHQQLYNGTPGALSPAAWSDGTSYAVGALCLGIGSVGIFLNTMVIFSIIQNHQLRSHISNVLICNLAVGSLIGCVVVLTVEVPIRIMSKSAEDEIQNTTCDIIGFITSVLNIGTVWSVVALSIDKYRSIDSPLHHSIMANTLKSVSYFLMIWIIASVLSSCPFLVGQTYVFQPAEGTCGFLYWDNPSFVYVLVYVSLVFYIPAAVVCFCHWRIFAIARSQSRRMAAMVHLVTLIHVPLLNGRMANQQISPQGRKAIYTTSIFVGTFLACYAPYALVSTVRIFWEVFNNQVLISVATLLMRSSFVVNIFIYGCRNRMVRDSLAKYVRRKVSERTASSLCRRPSSPARNSRREIVRVDRGPTHRPSYHRPVLHPVRSQPNLSTLHFTPVLPRAISMDVDMTRDGSVSPSVAQSTSSRELKAAVETGGHRSQSNSDSLEVIKEDDLLKLHELSSSRDDDDHTVHTDAESPAEPDALTPMLLETPSPEPPIRIKCPSTVTVNSCCNSSDTPQIIKPTANGSLPLTSTADQTFVHLKESIV